MINRLKGMTDLGFMYPEGAFYVFVDISKILGRKINGVEVKSSLDFANELLDQSKVAVIPGLAFGSDNYIRLSYATSLELIEEGLNRIEDFIK